MFVNLKKSILFFIICCFFTCSYIYPNSKKLPFKTGEQITYNVNWNGFNIGEMFLTFCGKQNYNGKTYYKITSEAHTSQYDGLDIVYVDLEKFVPVHVIRKVDYLGKKELINESYDQINNKVIITKTVGSKETKKVFIKNNEKYKDKKIQNSILLYYLTRLKSFKIGESFDVILPTKDYLITVKKIEKIKLYTEKKQEAYLFESKPSGIKIWISNDKNKIPLKIKFTKFLSIVTMTFKKINFIDINSE